MRVLIADDERISRRLLERTLCSWGHEVVCAENGLDAWEVLQQPRAPELVILDCVMPGLSGLDVCRKIRSLPAIKHVHIVMLSGRSEKNDVLAGLQAGANDYLTKPFDRAELQARVRVADQMIAMRSKMMAELRERRRAEQVLLVSERRFRSLIENSSDAIALFQLDGTINYASPSTLQVLGYLPNEFEALNALQIIHPDDRKVVKEQLKLALDQPRNAITTEARVRHKDGNWHWMEGTFTNLLSDPGVGAIVNNYRDITERKQAEEALREKEQQLQLSQKLEAVGRLAGGIAHDFNNLLTIINGYASLLLDKIDDPSLAGKIAEIKKAGERAASLTRQLLAFSRKQVLQPKELDLNGVVTNVATMLQRLIGEDIELVLSLKAALGHVRADPGQLEQVLMNLTMNARDSMPNGGKVSIKTENVELDQSYASQHTSVQAGSYVMLSVSDAGAGMDPETLRQIFEPFFTTKPVGQGTGLGLATVYGIVKQSGGNIWVYSEPGLGTSFKIYLPRINAQADQMPTPAERQLPRGTETILLVEDELMVRNIARETLELYGYTVMEASDGSEALNLSSPYGAKIDLLLTDVVMPVMGGRELAERLGKSRPETAVLYMSGYTDDAIVHHGVLDAGTHFLEKPFAPDALARKVYEVLHHRGGLNSEIVQ
jgi:PAS domain S-box-containing protein